VPPPEAPVIGIHKITRHPILVGAFLWGIAQVCSKVAINDLVFWGPLPVFSVLAGLHQDTRHRKQYVVISHLLKMEDAKCEISDTEGCMVQRFGSVPALYRSYE